ncbi:ATP-dependent zinc protease [Vibrio sp. SM6]|uniref:ATP-dependent zinc protease n=1 Tax=Vibrio agarilyticus TaxID=2726741 RepID=A0A7X8YF48_9VIBR|nr:ATP-dependent zinc protease [Vibrio agarilyticus]NLS11289.1 ATP-dependent zinc protease [Vibrio agarilyticus]
MFIRLASIAALFTLSGCTLLNGEQYHQQTLAAINQSETHLSDQLVALQDITQDQNADILRLESEVVLLQNELVSYKEQLGQLSSQIKAIPAIAPAPVKVEPTTERQTTAEMTTIASPIILGAVERVTIESIKQSFKARVDTGATTSSLNAVDLEMFERDGKDWVRFHLADADTPANEQHWIEAPVVRYVKIRQSTSDEVERRPVVELWVQLGSIREKAQFTLADRSQMTFPILLGREFIRDIAVVDVSKEYIHTNKSSH